MFRQLCVLLLLVVPVLACNFRFAPRLPAEIPVETPAPAPTVASDAQPASTPGPTATPAPPRSAIITLLEQFSTAGQPDDPDNPPLHGLWIALVLPLVVFGIPWVIVELAVVRYVQPQGFDISRIRIKARDGLFIEALTSLTARRMINLASARSSWRRAVDFAEKSIEQELLHAAANYPTLEDLERNLKALTEDLMNLPVVRELSRDYGIQVIRFNIEVSYPPDTMEALQRKADASAGGVAYLAFAAAATLDPNASETRELYRVYQETTSQVDAARNFGGSVSSIVGLLNRPGQEPDSEPN